MIKLLTFTTLYPNPEQPRHGIFVETRLRKMLSQDPDLRTVVIAPVPWFPLNSSLFHQYSKYARIPLKNTRNGITIFHPRYPVIPKIGMNIAPFLMFIAMLPVFIRMKKKYDFDLIDSHYFYPDGVTAALLGKFFSKPVVITARGSDINVLPNYFLPRTMIRWAGRHASAIIAVSKKLAEKIQSLGINSTKIRICRNGVDLQTFSPPKDRENLRKQLGLNGTVILSVGNLISLKGHDIVIQALKKLPGKTLIIIGKGPKEESLKQLVLNYGLTERVQFIGEIEQDKLAKYYGAADILTLASSREGMPNVVLESIACGTPVVATRVGGIEEIITSRNLGILTDERSVEGIYHGITDLLELNLSRKLVRKHAIHFSWDKILTENVQIYKDITAQTHVS